MPETITEFAPAKINLAIHVLGRRTDGFHELDSIVAFADIGDRLTLVRAERFEIVASGPFGRDLPPLTDNIVYLAWKSFAVEIPAVAPVRVHIEKNLPVSSGIGGGSANAAATIRGLIKLFNLSLSQLDLEGVAIALGADVPVCLKGETCRMQGIGECITPIDGLGPLHAVLVNPGVEVSTVDVFAKLGLVKGERNNLVTPPSPLWGGVGVAPADTTRPPPLIPPHKGEGDMNSWHNDLTSPAIAIQPVIAEVLAVLPRGSMSGSGATCFSIFESREKAAEFASDLRKAHGAWWIRDTTIGG